MNLEPSDNADFRIATEFITNTSRHVFLTGNAGTGKTTFLKYIRTHTSKVCAVVAPTGIAAINAGGTTIHSQFQLPLSPFVPGDHSFLQNLKIGKSKSRFLNNLELLIIDEVSLVRADTLDAMDTVLRHVCKRKEPFGGVQVLYIGDLFQLPPVIPNDHWSILRNFYDSGFFFDARVIEEAPPLYIELKKVYRQKDPDFVALLNRIRRNQVIEKDYTVLEKRYQPEFMPDEDESYVILTTHNRMADQINERALNNLPGKKHCFTGEVDGDFPDRLFPTELNLYLKEGAQVMFIRNDTEAERRYFNGKIGRVTAFDDETITVNFPNENREITVERVEWKNISYSLQDDDKQVKENVLGTFRQFPVRLAWAITIHKSQGLTLERAVIDAGASFAPGQVYVALSRCTSLEGIVLRSRITPSCISVDERVVAFASREMDITSMESLLAVERRRYVESSMKSVFSFTHEQEEVAAFHSALKKRKIPDKEAALNLATELAVACSDLEELCIKFRKQLDGYISREDFDGMKERIASAYTYFNDQITNRLIGPVNTHLDSLKGQDRVRKYRNALIDLGAVFERKLLGMGKLTTERH